MIQWKHNMIDLPNIECASEHLKRRPQPKTQAKRSPDYSASRDKEIMIKPLEIEYILIKDIFLSSKKDPSISDLFWGYQFYKKTYKRDRTISICLLDKLPKIEFKNYKSEQKCPFSLSTQY